MIPVSRGTTNIHLIFHDLAFLLDCYVGKGKDYRGFKATTESGRKCQPWKNNPGETNHWLPSRLVGLVNFFSVTLFSCFTINLT